MVFVRWGSVKTGRTVPANLVRELRWEPGGRRYGSPPCSFQEILSETVERKRSGLELAFPTRPCFLKKEVGGWLVVSASFSLTLAIRGSVNYLSIALLQTDSSCYSRSLSIDVLVMPRWVVFKEQQFTNWKQPKWPATRETLGKLQYIHKKEYFTAIKNDVHEFSAVPKKMLWGHY